MSQTVAIVGPTASGKTSLSLRLAHERRRESGGPAVEIVNADALQAYRHLSIGTDKPSDAERAAVPHHLIDILEPDEPYSAAEFARRARAAIEDIHGRGGEALVVGGSGFYQKALFQGLSELPASRPEVRQALEDTARIEGLRVLYERLQRVDPESADRLAPGDRQRIVRALEIHELSGRSMTEILKDSPVVSPMPVAVRIGLTLPRTVLYDRVTQRVREMLRDGWIDEVKSLLDAGVAPSAPAFQAIGYRQIVAHLRGQARLDATANAIVVATRRYAKRQLTWFRKEPDIQWISSLEPDEAFAALRKILSEDRSPDQGAFAQ